MKKHTHTHTHKRLLVHENYSNISNCRTNITAIFRGVYNFLVYFKTVMYFFRYLSQNPKRCSEEP